ALAAGAGIAAVLAVMAKQPYLAFIPAIPFAALAGAWLRRGSREPVHPAVRALQVGWGWYLAGCAATAALIVAYFAAAGAFVLVLTLRHPPPPSRPLVTIVAYGVLVSIGLVALVTTVALEGPWLRNNPTAQALRGRLFPPELVFLALFMQWLTQFHYDGLV